MHEDYKYAMQMVAEELAADMGLDYFDLPHEKQMELYRRAMGLYADSLADQADYLRKAEREK